MKYSKQQLIDRLMEEYELFIHDGIEVDKTPEEYQAYLETLTVEQLIIETTTDATFTLTEYMRDE